ncbi:MAG: hypothetical protein R3B74_05055 [Nitrospirales bacterium]|nr:hypothetical protein [Nitrospirales bacterium]
MKPRLSTSPQESLLKEAELVGTVPLSEAVRDLSWSEPRIGTHSENQMPKV